MRCSTGPFTKLWLYEDARILGSVKTVSKMFPKQDRQGVAVSGGATQESSTGGGADQRYLSPQDRTPPYSRLSLPTESRTSREEESPKLAGSLRGGDPDLGDLQHDVSGAGIDHPTRPGGDQGITADTGDAAASEELDPGGGSAILVSLTRQLPFGIVAAHQLFDLCATGRQTRSVTRKR